MRAIQKKFLVLRFYNSTIPASHKNETRVNLWMMKETNKWVNYFRDFGNNFIMPQHQGIHTQLLNYHNHHTPKLVNWILLLAERGTSMTKSADPSVFWPLLVLLCWPLTTKLKCKMKTYVEPAMCNYQLMQQYHIPTHNQIKRLTTMKIPPVTNHCNFLHWQLHPLLWRCS
jgi:hypothetical protein